MSWTDKTSVRIIKELRDEFKVNTLIETGTFKGINARLHSGNFKHVLTCEKIKHNYKVSLKKLQMYQNVFVCNQMSVRFLEDFVESYREKNRDDYIIIYLDAHFYDPMLPRGKGKFVVLEELKKLKKFDKCIIIIHDFDNNLGHITYDGLTLNLDLVLKDLLNVNSDFKFYTNELASCDIVTKEDVLNDQVEGLEPDFETLDNLDYLWTTPRLTYRGILYCLPKEMYVRGLREIK